MSNLLPFPHIKLLVSILDRGKGAGAVDLFRSRGLQFDYLCMGLGTAGSRILDYFGLSETEKDVVLTLVGADRVREVMEAANEKFQFSHPGRGILFTLPLSGVSGQVPRVLCREPGRFGEECASMENASCYDLIMVVVNRGSLDTVMDAARSEGARGGTVLHARRVGGGEQEGLLGFALEPEKEVVAILSPRAQKHAIMQAVSRAAGMNTPSAGVLFSLPVEDMMGLQPAVREDGAQQPGKQ